MKGVNEAAERHLPLKILIKRIEAMVPIELVVSPALLFFIACLEEMDRPGSAVLWAYTLMLRASEELEPCAIHNFAQSRFPMGVPTRKAMDAAWVAQKRIPAKGTWSLITSWT